MINSTLKFNVESFNETGANREPAAGIHIVRSSMICHGQNGAGYRWTNVSQSIALRASSYEIMIFASSPIAIVADSRDIDYLNESNYEE